MRAAQYNEYGDPEVIKINNVKSPDPGKQQVIIKVISAAINPFDGKLRQGYMKDSIPLSFPVTIGGDFSGVITQIAPDVSDFKVGDEVYGSANVLGGGSGAAAQFAAANVRNIAKRPESISHAQAAAIVLVGVSAVDVIEKLQIGEGKKVLIHGGAGGIGSAAVQYAKSLSAYVAATASAADEEFVSGLGADAVIDYESQKFEELLKGYDAVLDTVGGDVYAKSFRILKPGGILVSMIEQPNEQMSAQYSVKSLHQSTRVTSESLRRLSQLVEKNLITPVVDKIYPFDQVVDAFKYMEQGHPRGKVVIEVA